MNEFIKNKAPPKETREITKEEMKDQRNGGDLSDEEEDIANLSKVVKVKQVEKVKLSDHTQSVQAILINPKWRPYTEYGYDKEYTSSKNLTGEASSSDEEEEKKASTPKKKSSQNS